MRLPLLFRRENSSAARREREEQVERAVAAGFRALAALFERAAGVIEARRLARGGYRPEQFLERTRATGPSTRAEPTSEPPGVAAARERPER